MDEGYLSESFSNCVLFDSVNVQMPERRRRDHKPYTPTDEGATSRYVLDGKHNGYPYVVGELNSIRQETGDNSLTQPICNMDPLDVFEQDRDGDTNLHNAVIQLDDNRTLVELCIRAAPNSEWLNVPNLLLQTPLHLAVIVNRVDIVRRLMVGGGRVECFDTLGNTPLHIACREGYADIVECLLKPVYYEEIVASGYTDIPYQRIPQNLSSRNAAGDTCLHLAAYSTHLKVMELLLSKGARVNDADGTSGRTVLHFAAETGNRILLRYMLSQRRLDVSPKTFGGLSPLRLAAGRGHQDVVDILVVNGALDDEEPTESDSEDVDNVIDDFCINGVPIIMD